jgi:hypothetical protein
VPRHTLLAVLAVAASLVPGANAAGVLPTLYVKYAMNCTFTITNDDGGSVSSIAPGTYQVDVTSPLDFQTIDLSGISDFTACRGFARFQLTGPGVSLGTTIGDGGESSALMKATFQAGSTYVALDLNQPSVARVAFTTTATGTPGSPTTPSSSVSSQGTGGAAAKIPFRGSLDAIVYSAKKLTLTRNGKKVISLKTGQYTFSVDDESAKAGFSVQVLHGKAQTVTSAAYTGSHDVTLTLKPGRWSFFTPGGTKNVFFVVT